MPPSWFPPFPTTVRRPAGVILLAAALLTAGPTAAAESPASSTNTVGVLDRLAVENTPGDDDGPTGTTTWLRTPTERIQIVPEAVRGIPSGSTLSLRLVHDDLLHDTLLHDKDARVPASPHRVTSVTVMSRASSTSPAPSAANRHVVTIVLALPKGVDADGVTATSLSRTVSGGVSSYWSSASEGRIRFTVSRTVGWTRLTASCNDVWGIWDQARAKSAFLTGPRRHLLVYVPPSAGCPAGLATVGGSADAGGMTLVGGHTTSLIAHELGHNLGLGHSDALTCTGTSDARFHAGEDGGKFGGTCRHVLYGDWYDVMGISWEQLGSLSTAHAYRLGLLGPGSVLTAGAPARVTLRPVSGRTGLRSLRVVDPAGATYVVEYRPASGLDGWIGTDADWKKHTAGVLIRRVDPEDPAQTLLLDATPGPAPEDDHDVTLVRGQVLKTASGRVSLVAESITSAGATVVVAVDDVWPGTSYPSRGRLVSGRQITIGEALTGLGAGSS
ncbi:MAG: hypothetical protein QG622_193 [Actinomycetota bacterium]|nr:hypothetical protein [Actinomycetota bacterium]